MDGRLSNPAVGGVVAGPERPAPEWVLEVDFSKVSGPDGIRTPGGSEPVLFRRTGFHCAALSGLEHKNATLDTAQRGRGFKSGGTLWLTSVVFRARMPRD